MIHYGIVVHGGAGSPSHFSDGCKAACESAFSSPEAGKSSLDAVVEAARMLEDDGRFNAGSGSACDSMGNIEMDHLLWFRRRSRNIMAIRNVKNPIWLPVLLEYTSRCFGRRVRLFCKQAFEPFNKSSQRTLKDIKR
jgi:isoaspartyl peptidase/L-asparaginase-like protein (Ntn-hydrolase superfamily)